MESSNYFNLSPEPSRVSSDASSEYTLKPIDRNTKIDESLLASVIVNPQKFNMTKSIWIWRQYLWQERELGELAHFQAIEKMVNSNKSHTLFNQHKFYVEVWLKYVTLTHLIL